MITTTLNPDGSFLVEGVQNDSVLIMPVKTQGCEYWYKYAIHSWTQKSHRPETLERAYRILDALNYHQRLGRWRLSYRIQDVDSRPLLLIRWDCYVGRGLSFPHIQDIAVFQRDLGFYISVGPTTTYVDGPDTRDEFLDTYLLARRICIAINRNEAT